MIDNSESKVKSLQKRTQKMAKSLPLKKTPILLVQILTTLRSLQILARIALIPLIPMQIQMQLKLGAWIQKLD